MNPLLAIQRANKYLTRPSSAEVMNRWNRLRRRKMGDDGDDLTPEMIYAMENPVKTGLGLGAGHLGLKELQEFNQSDNYSKGILDILGVDMNSEPTNMWGSINRIPSLFGRQEPPTRLPNQGDKGLLDQIKQGANLPPGPITPKNIMKSGLMSDDKQPSLWDQAGTDLATIKKFKTEKEEYLEKQERSYDKRNTYANVYTYKTTKKQIDNFKKWYEPDESGRKDGNGYTSLQSLDPNFSGRLLSFIKDVYDSTGYMLKVGTVPKGTVIRSPEQQDALYAKGKDFTKAKSFESPHNYGKGADISIFHYSDNTKSLWSDKLPILDQEKIEQIADKYHLKNFRKAKGDPIDDSGHFQPKEWKKPDDANEKREQYYEQKRIGEGGFNTRIEPSKKKTAYPEPKSARLLEYQRLLKEDATE